MRPRLFSSVLTSVLALFLAWAASAWSTPARAQDPRPPADVSFETIDLASLPAAPEGFTTREEGSVRWDHPTAAVAIVDQLAAAVRTEWPRIERELGVDVDDAVVIRVARNPDEMAALAPPDAPPPAYAVGVAYPASGLILLTLSAPGSWERPDLLQVVVHELSHVALHRAVAGRPVPRWFTEGVAIHQAHERSFDRMQTLWDATVRGTLIPLDDLSRSFPSRAHEVNVAYAESADFVDWLFRHGEGEGHFAQLIRRLGRGHSFEAAVSQTWSAGIGQLEHEWRAGLGERYGAMPLLFGTGAIWFLISVLVVLAWIRRRRDARVTLTRWEIEETAEARAAARARAIAELRARGAMQPRSAAAVPEAARRPEGAEAIVLDAETEEDDDDATEDEATPSVATPTRDPHLPTITWEGRNHTLH